MRDARVGISKAPGQEVNGWEEFWDTVRKRRRGIPMFPTGNTVGTHGFPQWSGQRADGTLLLLFELILLGHGPWSSSGS